MIDLLQDDQLFEKIPRRHVHNSRPTTHSFPTCSGKYTYDKKGATLARQVALKRGEPYIRIYRCPTCRHWHLTHKPRRIWKA